MSRISSDSHDSDGTNDVTLDNIDELLREGFSLVETVYRELNLPSPVSQNYGEIGTLHLPDSVEIIEIGPTTSEAATIIPASSERRKTTSDAFNYGRKPSTGELNAVVADDGSYACPVCYEKVSSRTPTAPKCGHVFCEACIYLALRHNHKCPLCNSKLDKRSLRRIFL